MEKINIIIVSHNCVEVIKKNLSYLDFHKNEFNSCYVIDSGSSKEDLLFLKEIVDLYDWCNLDPIGYNVGFGKANNYGYKKYSKNAKYTLLLNPDAFIIEADTLRSLCSYMDENVNIAACSPVLYRFNFELNRPLGEVDSSGIYKSLLRYYDSNIDIDSINTFDNKKKLVSLCGAFMFLRNSCVETMFDKSSFVFDENIFMYKEDIEFGLRAKKSGFNIAIVGGVKSYHCRGLKSRSESSSWQKLESAKNEMYIAWKHKENILPFSFLKYLFVRFFNF
ncbi:MULTISPECIES: glycosyltransferase [Pectobacterium]|uniref:glycosyltransferase n=1 Tax=Pectobacterium TaxID=122277 RepID=UPI0010FF4374|nr:MULTISPECIES: glycosyltransferase [Pectobacterium]KAA3667405.1 glycosyltransferase family 2 protein [Pectobacterium carotovorum subsp. carotovorum]MCA6925187.1 glycosyltransferase [Pectobacterium versatile]MCH5081947.1 glycosyltransferase family 2 protein [Pectobacterium versatile]